MNVYEIHFANIQFALQFQEIHIPILLAVKYIGNALNKPLAEGLRLELQRKGFDCRITFTKLNYKIKGLNPHTTQVNIQNSILSIL